MKTLNFATLIFIIFSDRLTELRERIRKSNKYNRSNTGQKSVKCRSVKNDLTGQKTFTITEPVKSGQIRSNDLTAVYINKLHEIRSKPVKSVFQFDRLYIYSLSINYNAFRSIGQIFRSKSREEINIFNLFKNEF
jgi:hypothetical protein